MTDEYDEIILYEEDEEDEEDEDEEDEDEEEELNQKEQNAYAEIMGDMVYAVASSIPPLSFVVAVSEVTKAAWDLYGAKDNSPEASQAKFQLLMGIICVIPGIGGGFRLAFKSLIRKPQYYGPVMFDVVVAILEEANRKFNMNLPLNPEKYLTQMIDVPTLQNYLDDIRVKSVAELEKYTFARWAGLPGILDEFLRSLSGQLTTIIEDVLAPAVRIAIERSIMHRKNSAGTSNVTTKKTNTTNKGSSKPTVTRSRGNLRARIQSEFKNININFVIGGVGEHIADYYCLERLGWGKDQWDGHDKAQQGKWKKLPSASYLGKLNNNKKLKRNSAINNETGIDGFWRADPINNQYKKYAVVEAKATMGVARATTKYVASRLGVLAGKYKGKPVIQMDHYWIGLRIITEIRNLSDDIKRDFAKINKLDQYKRMYTRHIIIASLLVDPGLSHIEALLDKTKSDLDHTNHGCGGNNDGSGFVIHKYGEPTIERIISEKHQWLENKKDTSNQKKTSKK
ncbi:hypothetical protein [Gilliamella apicola]|uniref:hypothetical protein n=1 Tax=Gilliamella apicola TaxID=1196095 RepID=UPI002FEE5B8E